MARNNPMVESYLPNLMNALQDAVFILDQNRVVLKANPVADTMFGKSYVGQDFVKVTRHPDCMMAVNAILEGTETASHVVAAGQVNNSKLSISVASLGTQNPDGACAVVSIKDITDMQEAEQMRTDFVANVSHELRSPLTALTGFVETLKTVPDIDDDSRNRFLELMDVESQRMVRLIADLLSLSKVEAKQRMRPDGEANVIAVLERVQATLADQAFKEAKKFDFKFSKDIGSIPGNEDELTQVFQNLIENAVKYGRRNSTVTISAAKVDKYPGISGPAIVVEVRDEGEGFEQHHIPRLTERFYRVDSHRSRNKGGTGLGLAIVKHIISRHRGRLLIASSKGEGSKFTVCLPSENPG